jgi:hypothetical protein
MLDPQKNSHMHIDILFLFLLFIINDCFFLDSQTVTKDDKNSQTVTKDDENSQTVTKHRIIILSLGGRGGSLS